jgi:hypothetical protein
MPTEGPSEKARTVVGDEERRLLERAVQSLGFGTSAARRAIKPSGSDMTRLVPSRADVDAESGGEVHVLDHCTVQRRFMLEAQQEAAELRARGLSD